jgi:hypothetical protein
VAHATSTARNRNQLPAISQSIIAPSPLRIDRHGKGRPGQSVVSLRWRRDSTHRVSARQRAPLAYLSGISRCIDVISVAVASASPSLDRTKGEFGSLHSPLSCWGCCGPGSGASATPDLADVLIFRLPSRRLPAQALEKIERRLAELGGGQVVINGHDTHDQPPRLTN